MVKKILFLVILGVLVSSAAFAMCGMCDLGDSEAAEKSVTSSAPIKVNNSVCPVTGERVDVKNPVTVEDSGKIYNLCCPGCIAEFKKEPAKYIAKIESQKR